MAHLAFWGCKCDKKWEPSANNAVDDASEGFILIPTAPLTNTISLFVFQSRRDKKLSEEWKWMRHRFKNVTIQPDSEEIKRKSASGSEWREWSGVFNVELMWHTLNFSLRSCMVLFVWQCLYSQIVAVYRGLQHSEQSTWNLKCGYLTAPFLISPPQELNFGPF